MLSTQEPLQTDDVNPFGVGTASAPTSPGTSEDQLKWLASMTRSAFSQRQYHTAADYLLHAINLAQATDRHDNLITDSHFALAAAYFNVSDVEKCVEALGQTGWRTMERSAEKIININMIEAFCHLSVSAFDKAECCCRDGIYIATKERVNHRYLFDCYVMFATTLALKQKKIEAAYYKSLVPMSYHRSKRQTWVLRRFLSTYQKVPLTKRGKSCDDDYNLQYLPVAQYGSIPNEDFKPRKPDTLDFDTSWGGLPKIKISWNCLPTVRFYHLLILIAVATLYYYYWYQG